MSATTVCWCKDASGAFLAHHQDPLQMVNKQRAASQLRWKQNLFAIQSPFMMDSQMKRIQREREEWQSNTRLIDTSCQRKRKKKLNCTKPFSDSELMVTALINKALPLIVERAREMKMLRDVKYALLGPENNKLAREAASIPGCGDMFHLLSQDVHQASLMNSSHIQLHQGMLPIYKTSDVIGRPVTNATQSDICCDIGDNKFVIPAESCFLTSSFQEFVSHGFSQLNADSGYDLVVLDPPWPNKSVKRKRSYHTLAESDLLQVPVSELCQSGSLVCVWVTNNSRLLEFVTETLFPAWSVAHLATWIWMKVTLNGEPVCDLNSSHKKPYEQIIIGRYSDKTERNVPQLSLTRGEPESWAISEICHHNKNNTAGDWHQIRRGESGTEICTSQCKKDNPSPIVKTTDGEEQSGLSSDSGSTDFPDAYFKVNKTLTYVGEKQRLDIQTRADVPDGFVLVSVPCALHSKKPPLGDVLQPYLPTRPKCLELFARNLTKGWTSWGDEPLRHQHLDYFEKSSA